MNDRKGLLMKILIDKSGEISVKGAVFAVIIFLIILLSVYFIGVEETLTAIKIISLN